MSNIYIDLGCYDGDTVLKFLKSKDESLPVSPKKFDIYACDPNPNFEKKWAKIMTEYPKVVFAKTAAWVEDGHVEFAIDKSKKDPYGSTLMRSKAQFKEAEKIINAKSFDFSAWLARFAIDDYVYVKMDIEGAEYAVLDKVIRDNRLNLIDRLDVEFHDRKIDEYNEHDTRSLIARIRDAGVELNFHS